MRVRRGMKVLGGCWMHTNHLQAIGDGRPSRREGQILCRFTVTPGNRDSGDRSKGLTVENTFKAEQRQMSRPAGYMAYLQAAHPPKWPCMQRYLGHLRDCTSKVTQANPTH
jgi:hypothetical protein